MGGMEGDWKVGRQGLRDGSEIGRAVRGWRQRWRDWQREQGLLTKAVAQ